MNIKCLVAITLIIGFQNIYGAISYPTLVSPKDGFITIENSARFVWNKATNSNSYTFQLSQDSAFSNIFFQTTTNNNTLITSLPFDEKLYWRVKNASPGTDTSWSSTWTVEHFNPGSISSMNLWLKVDSGVVSDINDNVQIWNDYSSEGNDASQPNSSFQPIVGNSTPFLNFYKPIEFDGSDDFLSITHNTSLNLGLSNTVFYVGNFKSTSSSAGIIAKRDPPNLSGIEHLKSGSNLIFVHRQASPAGNVNISTPYPFGYNMFNMSRDDDNASFRINGNSGAFSVSPSNTDVDVNCSAPLYVGSNRTLSSYFLGDLFEVILLNSALTSSEIERVENYLRYKYAPPVNLGQDTTIEYGFCANIILNASDRFDSYIWSNGDTSSSISVSNRGVYSVTATDVFGFVSSDTVLVEYPTYSLPETNLFCKDDSVLWDTQLPDTYEFEWNTGDTIGSIFIDTPGDYWVKITDSTSNGSCFIYSDTISFLQDSFQNIATLGPDLSLCSGNKIGLVNGDSLAQSYLWSTSDTSSKITITNSGDYSLTATSGAGCVKKDTVTITISGSNSTVNFTQSGACVGAAISFTNQSIPGTGDTINGFLWDFGDGDSSTIENPSHTYSPGPDSTYEVQLRIFTTVGCSFATTKTIPVLDKPVSFFSDSIGCIGVQKTFSNLSTYSGIDSITDYFWDFGDNTTSQLENPNKTFSSGGTYNVELVVQTVNGCLDTFSRPVVISPSVSFPSSFSLTSPSNNIIKLRQDTLNLNWNRSNGALFYIVEFSLDPSFNSIYFASQALDTTQLFYLDNSNNSKVYWRVQAFNKCEEATTSNTRSVKFFSPPPNNSLWLMADRNVSTQSLFVNEWIDNSPNNNNAVQTTATNRPLLKTEPAINNKKTLEFGGNDFLTINNSASLQFSLEYSFIAVMKSDSSIPSQGFFAKRPANGSNGVEVVYTSSKDFIWINRGSFTNTNIQSDFFSGYNIIRFNRLNAQSSIHLNSDQIPTTNSNPSPGINVANSENLQIGTNRNVSNFFIGDFAEIFMFDKSLTNNEAESVEDYLNDKYAPPVNLGPDIVIDYGVCLNVELDASDLYVNYIWSTGDTTSAIQVGQTGEYSVTVTNIFNRVSSDTIKVNIPSTSSPSNTGICLYDSLQWNISLDKSLYSFSWSDGTTDSFIYMSQPGLYWVEITDTNNCSLRDSLITTIDSFANIMSLGGDTTMCSGNPIGVITSGFNPINSYQWSTNETSSSIIVSQSGDYGLAATNSNGCVANDSIFVDISGVAPTVSFIVENTCLGTETSFEDQTNVTNANITSWSWNFGDQTFSTEEDPTHVYDTTGNFNVRLTIETDSGCAGTTAQSILIKPRPFANYIHDASCASEPAVFQELSAPPSGGFITDRLWDFGNGETANVMNPVVFYDSSGTYEVSLVSSSNNGCFDTLTKSIEIYPAINPQIEAENLCIGNDAQFYDASPNYSNVSWVWDFGGDGNSTQQNPRHTFLLSGQYSISLTVTNALGCTESVSKLITIADDPDVNFQAESSCPNIPTSFSDLTQVVLGDEIIERKWTFGDSGVISRLPNPLHIYSDTGVFNVTLEIKTLLGCSSSFSKNVSVIPGPEAAFDFTPSFGGAPLDVEFFNQSIGASNYYWDFGDGSDINTETEPDHIYQNEGEFTTYLVAESNAGCTDTAFNDIFVTDALYDLIILGLETNKEVFEDCNYDLSTTVQFANQGTLPINAIKFSLRLNEKSTISEIWEGILQPGAIAEYTFNSKVNVLDCDEQYYVCVEATFTDGNADQTPFDNMSCNSVLPELVVSGIYPNPASEVLSMDIIAPTRDIINIELVDYNGAKLGSILDQEIPVGYSHFDFDVSQLNPGAYILNISYREEDISKKFIVID